MNTILKSMDCRISCRPSGIWAFTIILCVFLCRRLAEEAEASTGDVVEEIDELRRSFSARLRSESLQRQSDNLEKDSKIERLETILELQLRREKAKDQKIAELEEKVEAMVQMKQMKHQRPTAGLHKERASLLTRDGRDEVAEAGMERGRNSETDEDSRIHDSAAHHPLNWETEDELGSANAKDQTQHFEKLDEDCGSKETRVHGQRLPADGKSRGKRKLLCLMKRKQSRTKIT